MCMKVREYMQMLDQHARGVTVFDTVISAGFIVSVSVYFEYHSSPIIASVNIAICNIFGITAAT
jgi:hypothetical protein